MPTERLKEISGIPIVEVRVADVEQLFDHRDPAPFRRRDLDEEFASYLENYIDEIPRKKSFKIQIEIENSFKDVSAEIIRDSIHEYYRYQIKIKRLQLSKGWKTAHLFLLIGLTILAICLGISYAIKDAETELISSTLKEGVVIFGWVSMWRPIESLLFDWYPFIDKIRDYRRIMDAEIEIIFLEQTPTQQIFS